MKNFFCAFYIFIYRLFFYISYAASLGYIQGSLFIQKTLDVLFGSLFKFFGA